MTNEYQDRQGPVWLTDAAEALGAVRPDGTPLSLNWTQVLESIRDLRREKEVARPKLPKLVWNMTRGQMMLATLDLTKWERLGAYTDSNILIQGMIQPYRAID